MYDYYIALACPIVLTHSGDPWKMRHRGSSPGICKKIDLVPMQGTSMGSTTKFKLMMPN